MKKECLLQVRMEEEFLKKLDQESKKIGLDRSSFTRMALAKQLDEVANR